MAEKKSGFMAEFKKFIMRGNVLDMAVGLVVGSAFTAIVQSVVKDIINPVVGLLIGSIDFQELRIILKPATEAAGEVAIRYGALIQNIVQFIITAFVLFIIIRASNRVKEKKEAEAKAKADREAKAKAEEEAAKPAPVPEDIALLREIRDALKKN
ncbi:MAG: large conductance mechanosensitive channel protein MscL [Candidatus Ornithospirochaeta sp.]